MTTGEAIKILTGYMGGNIDPESTELYHAIELAVDILESQPSLPSNLDEAANNFGFKETAERLREGGIIRKNEGIFRWQIEKAFKAGAEWMTKQGQPDVDLEKVWDWIDETFTEREIDSRYGEAIDVVMSDFDVCKSDLRKKYERDFGLNTRKEE